MFDINNIDYNKLTLEQLEEYVEFIDWYVVPSHLVTDDIKKKFGAMKGLKIRLMVEDFFAERRAKGLYTI